MSSALGTRIISIACAFLALSALGFVTLAALDPDHRVLGLAAAVDVLVAALLLGWRRLPSWRLAVAWLGGAFLLAAIWIIQAGDQVWSTDVGLQDENSRLSVVLVTRAVLLGVVAIFFGREDVRTRYPGPLDDAAAE